MIVLVFVQCTATHSLTCVGHQSLVLKLLGGYEANLGAKTHSGGGISSKLQEQRLAAAHRDRRTEVLTRIGVQHLAIGVEDLQGGGEAQLKVGKIQTHLAVVRLAGEDVFDTIVAWICHREIRRGDHLWLGLCTPIAHNRLLGGATDYPHVAYSEGNPDRAFLKTYQLILNLTFREVLKGEHVRIAGSVEEFQLQCPGFAPKHLAISTELLAGNGGIIGRLRELDMLAGTHAGLATRIAATFGEVGIGEGHSDDALGTGDQLQAALVPHIPGHCIVLKNQRRALFLSS